ncbi:hypothetical protein [Nonomuraea sp. NPDC023979]|uniref:hypothetical protein n=1 Tax=Nonomuraea sp. NPDC023979 TaxID=3154796 RepID=UPI0033F657EE
MINLLQNPAAEHEVYIQDDDGTVWRLAMEPPPEASSVLFTVTPTPRRKPLSRWRFGLIASQLRFKALKPSPDEGDEIVPREGLELVATFSDDNDMAVVMDQALIRPAALTCIGEEWFEQRERETVFPYSAAIKELIANRTGMACEEWLNGSQSLQPRFMVSADPGRVIVTAETPAAFARAVAEVRNAGYEVRVEPGLLPSGLEVQLHEIAQAKGWTVPEAVTAEYERAIIPVEA